MNRLLVNIADVRVDWTTIGHGIIQYCAWHKDYVAPLGFAWVFRWTKILRRKPA